MTHVIVARESPPNRTSVRSFGWTDTMRAVAKGTIYRDVDRVTESHTRSSPAYHHHPESKWIQQRILEVRSLPGDIRLFFRSACRRVGVWYRPEGKVAAQRTTLAAAAPGAPVEGCFALPLAIGCHLRSRQVEEQEAVPPGAGCLACDCAEGLVDPAFKFAVNLVSMRARSRGTSKSGSFAMPEVAGRKNRGDGF